MQCDVMSSEISIHVHYCTSHFILYDVLLTHRARGRYLRHRCDEYHQYRHLDGGGEPDGGCE